MKSAQYKVIVEYDETQTTAEAIETGFNDLPLIWWDYPILKVTATLQSTNDPNPPHNPTDS